MKSRNFNILLIEDEPIDAKTLKRTLLTVGGPGTRLSHVETLKDGIALLKQDAFDLCLADMNLPDSQGLQTVRAVIQTSPDLPIVVLSGFASDEIAKEAVREGAQDYIAKSSLASTDIVKTIDFAIERHRLVAELRASRDRERRHAEFKSTFLAEMSHEIRTPMNGVIGMTSLLLSSESLSREHRDMVETVRASGESLLAIINDILDISKIEAGKIEIVIAPFNIRALIEDLIDTFMPVAAAKKLVLTTIVSPLVPKIVGADSQRLRQILSNIIGNALKFTEAGYVSVSVTLDQSKGEKLRLEIKDTGIGIPQNRMRELFRPFQQANIQHQFSGSGLGLAICKNLCQLMGGEIGVAEDEGDGKAKGTVFWFTIDFISAAAALHKERPDLSSSKVAVIGPSRETNAILQKQLELRGMHVETSLSVETALAKSKKSPIDLLIINGHELTPEDGATWVKNAKAQHASYKKDALLLTSGPAPGLAGAKILQFPLRQSTLYQVAANVITNQAEIDISPHHVPSPAFGTFKGVLAKVLVVDDGTVNRKVAAQMLQTLGCCYDCACDGSSAIEMLKTTKYDLIFMDCRMPVLSGADTTKAIRAMRDQNATTPIVALTANAFREDRDSCHAAGMNDFLAKPIQLSDIQNMINKWVVVPLTINSPVTAQEQTDSVSIAAEPVGPAIDENTMKMLKGLEDSENSTSFLDNLIDTFTHEAPAVITQLADALRAKSFEGARHYAHKLKGFSRNLGAIKLAELAGEIEDGGEPQLADNMETICAALQNHFEEAAHKLRLWHSGRKSA